eukprot:GGOE01045101.1.p3 GENE.GGOE01045101.1~~GGOE01045101.1.p3  ORF type:complete len:133 (-),score=26.37 GGOE01045101.1:413-781(-)
MSAVNEGAAEASKPQHEVVSETADVCGLVITQEENRGRGGPNGEEAKDKHWGRVATGTFHAYDTSLAPQPAPSLFLGVPQDRYKPSSVGKQKSSFLITREDLAARGEAVDGFSDDEEEPQPM